MKYRPISGLDVIADGQACKEKPNHEKSMKTHLDRIRVGDSDGLIIRGMHFAFLERQELDIEHEYWFALTGTFGTRILGIGFAGRGVSHRSLEH